MIMNGRRLAGVAAISLAVGFNVPYAMLASIYDYPQVLRGPAGEALELFRAGGPLLVLAWLGFMLSALAMTPLATALAITPARIAKTPALAVGAAMSGALAGLAQAIGLSRWVFVVPDLARDHADPAQRLAAEHSFDLLNAWGGVAIGEHLGQLLTAMFVLHVALMQRGERLRISSALGVLTATLIIFGAAEGPVIALGGSGQAFGLATIGGFLGLTLWLIVTGAGLMRAEPTSR